MREAVGAPSNRTTNDASTKLMARHCDRERRRLRRNDRPTTRAQRSFSQRLFSQRPFSSRPSTMASSSACARAKENKRERQEQQPVAGGGDRGRVLTRLRTTPPRQTTTHTHQHVPSLFSTTRSHGVMTVAAAAAVDERGSLSMFDERKRLPARTKTSLDKAPTTCPPANSSPPYSDSAVVVVATRRSSPNQLISK
uniref:Uncharacterized protein n=1 Tax=Plectus sambesii TaxID=2011161 RepID=A0A914UR55_9BILA